MTVPIILMMIIGLILIIASFFVAESLVSKEETYNLDFITIDEDYEFSERELRIIKRKIEDVIANHAKEILYETNDSLASMANEKTLALGDYAVAVCEEIEKNHKEVMFLYSMLDDKQKEIMNTVRVVDEINRQMKETVSKFQNQITVTSSPSKHDVAEEPPMEKKTSAIDQLSALAKRKREIEASKEAQVPQSEKKKQSEETVKQQEESALQNEEDSSSDMNISEMNNISVQQSDVQEEETPDEDVYEEMDQTDTDYDEVEEEEIEEQENSNGVILEMHRNGSSIIEIAKHLGLGVGEVKLVIDLYQGE